MEVKRRWILKRVDGVYVDIFYNPVKQISQAARFSDVKAFEQLIHGYFAPSDPSLYVAQEIEITYREVLDP